MISSTIPCSADTATFDNLVDSDDLFVRIRQVADGISRILERHAGPFSSDAIIGSKYRQANDIDEFTKDGIKILCHLISTEDPFARMIVRLTRFIGGQVDRRCHDGTTTSMFLFCLLVARIAGMIENGDARDKWRIRQIAKKTQQDLMNVFEHIGDLKITVDDLFARAEELGIETTPLAVRKAVAYHMAMISSKGDVDLSTKVAELVANSPKEMYGIYTTEFSPKEVPERFLLEKQKSDITLVGNIGRVDDLNYKNGTQYLAKDAVVFFTGNELVTGSMESEFLKAFISKDPRYRDLLGDFGMQLGWEYFHENRRNLVIMTTLVRDQQLEAVILEHNLSNPDSKITYFTIPTDPKMRINLSKTVHYIAGTPLTDDVELNKYSESLIGLYRRGVQVHGIGRQVSLTGLYDKDGSDHHPYYTNPEMFPLYTEFRNETRDMIEQCNQSISDPALDTKSLNQLIRLYRILLFQNIYDIKLGGTAHEQRANQTALEDALGAAFSALDEGMVLGGYAKLALGVTDEAAWLRTALVQVISTTMDITPAQAETFLTEGADTILDPWGYLVSAGVDAYSPNGDHVHIASLDRNAMEDFLAMRTTGIPVLVQAWSGYHEQFKRFADIIPKLANSGTFIDMRVKYDDVN